MCLLRSHVGENGDHALSAESQHRNDLVIVSGVYIHISAGELKDLCCCGEVSTRFLDTHNILHMPAETTMVSVRYSRHVRLGTL